MSKVNNSIKKILVVCGVVSFAICPIHMATENTPGAIASLASMLGVVYSTRSKSPLQKSHQALETDSLDAIFKEMWNQEQK